jgi:rRNA biogenesis protein RRP5
LLGCISGISHGRDSDLPELIVSLPNNLTGFVDISELSDELIQAAGDTLPDLKEQYFIGQWVQCVIIGLQYGASGGAAASGTDKQRRKIILSLKPFIVNAGVKPVDIAVGTVCLKTMSLPIRQSLDLLRVYVKLTSIPCSLFC